eukprot:401895-Rhodomonas_salina.1
MVRTGCSLVPTESSVRLRPFRRTCSRIQGLNTGQRGQGRHRNRFKPRFLLRGIGMSVGEVSLLGPQHWQLLRARVPGQPVGVNPFENSSSKEFAQPDLWRGVSRAPWDVDCWHPSTTSVSLWKAHPTSAVPQRL